MKLLITVSIINLFLTIGLLYLAYTVHPVVLIFLGSVGVFQLWGFVEKSRYRLFRKKGVR